MVLFIEKTDGVLVNPMFTCKTAIKTEVDKLSLSIQLQFLLLNTHSNMSGG